jgi:serine/threonine protein kinase
MNRSELSLRFPRRLRLPVSTPSIPSLPCLDRRQQALLKLRHPQIGPMYAYRESGQPRIGGVLLPGSTLADRMRRRRQAPYNLTETLELLTPVAHALEYIHSQNIAHGNLHPAAIVYMPSQAILTAFAGSAEPGPAIYRAPEQRPETISAQSDVYALAVIAYELLTGYLPGSEASGAATLPRGIDLVLTRALSRQPRRRPRSAQALIDGLQAAQRRNRQRAKQSWRHPGSIAIMLLLALCAGLIVRLLA